ncbi:MAG: imelysin family protein [Crocinitomicaceae bacterium]|nr:imelysin family protein [Crocinitomicaceae bacterium]
MRSIIFILIAGILFSGCKKKGGQSAVDSFDKAALLANTGENIILPAYERFRNSVDTLSQLQQNFISAPTEISLLELRTGFINSYKAYQWISTFEFGPADTEVARAHFNTFPCDTSEINTKIAAGNFNFSTIADLDTQGFPALDFLLYGKNGNISEIIGKFTIDANAGNRKLYLNAVVEDVWQRASAIYNAWNPSGGNYLQTFRSSTGNDVGSSLGLLVNQLNFDFEILKNARIGIPLGKKSMGVPLPDKCEALYSKQSLLLAQEHLKSVENIFLGRDKNGNNGIGFDDYLENIDAQYSSGSLSTAIKYRFETAKTKLAAITGTLDDAVINNPGPVDQAYAELQQLVVLLKVDMPSAMGVLITYQDNDGD